MPIMLKNHAENISCKPITVKVIPTINNFISGEKPTASHSLNMDNKSINPNENIKIPIIEPFSSVKYFITSSIDLPGFLKPTELA